MTPIAPIASRLMRAGLLALAVGLPLQAHALFGDDEARAAILDLRKRFDTASQAQAQLTQDNAHLRRSVLDLQAQIETLRSEVATMRGAQEQLTRDVSDTQQRQRDVSQGVEDRLNKIESGGAGAAPAANPASEAASAPPAGESTAATAKQEFTAALDVFRKGNFVAAQKSFAAFVKKHPQSPDTPAALYWMGNAQYATKSYKEAITSFNASVGMAPTSPMAAESLLSIANCQVELKDTATAKKTLQDLIKRFPKSEAAQAGKDRLASLK